MKKVVIDTACPACNKRIKCDVEIPDAAIAPSLRSGLKPNGMIMCYTVTSADITIFLTELVRQYCPTAKVEVVPRFCERKPKKGEPHRAYASLRIALSEDVVAKKGETGWYAKIGETESNVQVIESIFKRVISRYKYDKNIVNKWLSYKNMDSLEERMGITETYLEELREFCDVKMVKAAEGSQWLIFAADPTRVLQDMMSEVPDKTKLGGKRRDEDTMPGDMRIMDVRLVNNDMVEYTIFMYPKKMSGAENPHVRMILTGDEKTKK